MAHTIKDGEIVINTSSKTIHIIIDKVRTGRCRNLIDNNMNVVAAEQVKLPNVDYFCKNEGTDKVYRIHFKDDDTIYSVTSTDFKYIGQRIGYSTNALGLRCKAPGISIPVKNKIKELMELRLSSQH